MSYYNTGLATSPSAPLNHNLNSNYYNNYNNYDYNYVQKNHNNYSSLPKPPYYTEYGGEPYNFANYGDSIQRKPIPIIPIGIPISSMNKYPYPNAYSDYNQEYRSSSYDQLYHPQSASEYNTIYENTNSHNYNTANYGQSQHKAINSYNNSYNKSPTTYLHTHHPKTEKYQDQKFKRTRQKLLKPPGSYLQRPAQRRSIGGTILRMMFFPMAFMQMMFFPVSFFAVLMMVGQIIYYLMPKPSLPDIPSLLRFDMDLDFTSNSTAEREAKTTMPTSRRPKITKLGLQAPPLPTLLDIAGVGPALMQLQALKDLKLRVVKKKNKMKGIESSEEDEEDGMTQMSSRDDAQERRRRRPLPSKLKTGRKKKRGNFKYSDIALKTLKTVYNHYTQN